MLVRVSLRRCLVVMLTACGPSSGPPAALAVWPPEEGHYCGGSPSQCDKDGDVWICGSRPLWHRSDCASECAAIGLTHRGCVTIGSDDRDALADRVLPGAGSSAAIPEARCLCTGPEDIECAGPSQRLCADRSALLICTDQLRWSRVECSSLCAALIPGLVAETCVHGVGPGESDACRCAAHGAPCQEEGTSLCVDDRVYACAKGVLGEIKNCSNELSCGDGQVAACIFDTEVHCECIPE